MKMLGKILYACSLKFLDAYGLREKFLNVRMLEFFYALHIVWGNTIMQKQWALNKYGAIRILVFCIPPDHSGWIATNSQ